MKTKQSIKIPKTKQKLQAMIDSKQRSINYVTDDLIGYEDELLNLNIEIRKLLRKDYPFITKAITKYMDMLIRDIDHTKQFLNSYKDDLEYLIKEMQKDL